MIHTMSYQSDISRRDFIASSALALWAVAPWRPTFQQGQAIDRLCMLALDAARVAGAEYADARGVDRATRVFEAADGVAPAVRDTSMLGIGVRALVGGRWGFASTATLERTETAAAARRAVDAAKSAGTGGTIVLAPVRAAPDAAWRTLVRTDPFDADPDELKGRLGAAADAAMAMTGVASVSARVACVRYRITFASTDGSLIRQDLYRVWPSLSVGAKAADGGVHNHRALELTGRGAGLEVLDGVDLAKLARKCGEEAVESAGAGAVSAGPADLVIGPAALAAVLRETIGHATRGAQGGLGPPTAVLGQLRVGPESLQIQCDRTQRGALATVGWDDEGVAADSWPVVRDGVLVDFQTTRESARRIGRLTGVDRSHGCAAAPAWDQPPVVGMANLALLPGSQDVSLDQLVSGTDRGVLVTDAAIREVRDGGRSCVVEGRACREIRAGAAGSRIADVVFGIAMPDFWDAVDAVGGPDSYVVVGTRKPGEAFPEAWAEAASVGAPPIRVRGVTVSAL